MALGSHFCRFRFLETLCSATGMEVELLQDTVRGVLWPLMTLCSQRPASFPRYFLSLKYRQILDHSWELREILVNRHGWPHALE